MNKTPRFLLLIKHSRGWDVDRVNLWAEKRGHNVTRCFPADGDPFPSAKMFDGVVIFGGAMSANDCREQAWMRAEMEFIDDCLEANIKYFGICLGAQLLARVLGATVCEPSCKNKEVGFYPLTPVGESQFLADGDTMFQWHSEGFSLPQEATLLASTELFPNQAFKLAGDQYGVQFHPEVNPEVLKLWHARIPDGKYPWLTPELREAHIQQCAANDARITLWLEAFLDQWIAKKD